MKLNQFFFAIFINNFATFWKCELTLCEQCWAEAKFVCPVCTVGDDSEEELFSSSEYENWNSKEIQWNKLLWTQKSQFMTRKNEICSKYFKWWLSLEIGNKFFMKNLLISHAVGKNSNSNHHNKNTKNSIEKHFNYSNILKFIIFKWNFVESLKDNFIMKI